MQKLEHFIIFPEYKLILYQDSLKLLKLYVTLAHYYYNVFHFPLSNIENTLQVRSKKEKKLV